MGIRYVDRVMIFVATCPSDELRLDLSVLSHARLFGCVCNLHLLAYQQVPFFSLAHTIFHYR